MKTRHLRGAVRDGIEAFDGSTSFRNLIGLAPVEFTPAIKDAAAYGLSHGVVTGALPEISAEVQRIHSWDRLGCIKLAAQIDTLIRDVTTDALTLGVLTMDPVRNALAMLGTYSQGLKEGV